MMNKIARKARHGFTLVEIMIVVLIIGILLAIAIPNFIRARESSRTRACQGNLKQLESAKEQYAMDQRLTNGAAVTMGNLVPDYIKRTLTCPSNGAYTVGDVGADPECSGDASHVLP